MSTTQRGVLRWSDLANPAGALTLGRLGIAVIFPLLVHSPALALGAYILALVTDVLDGNIARRMNTVSHTGAVMDGWVDKILHINGAWALVMHGLMPGWWMWLWFSREIILWLLFMTLVPDLRRGRVRPYTASLAGKLTAVLLALSFVLVLLEQPALAEPLTWMIGPVGALAAAGYIRRALDDRSQLR